MLKYSTLHLSHNRYSKKYQVPKMKKTFLQFENMSQKSGGTLGNNESSSAAQGYQRHKHPIAEHQRANDEKNCFTRNFLTGSITHCPIDLNTRFLVLKAIFTMLSPLKYEAMVFLFEDIVIFTQQALTSTGEQQYNYVDSIEMKDLSIETFELQSLLFHLINFSKVKDQNELRERYTYTLQSSSKRVKQNWVQCIKNKLSEQLNQCKGEQKHASTSLTDDGGDVMVRTLMEESPIYENSPSFQLSQKLRDETTSHDDASNTTNTMKNCPGTDLSLQKPMKMAPVDRNSPNLQLSRILQQGLKNLNRTKSDTTDAASFTDSGGNARVKTPMEKSPIYENSQSFLFSRELRDGTKNRDEASNKRNAIKYCSEPNTPMEKSPIYENSPNFQLRQELQDGTKNYDDDHNKTNLMKYCPGTNLPLQKPMQMAPVDRNSPNIQLSRVLQQGLKNKNRDQSDTTNAASFTNNGGNVRVKTPMEKSPIYENPPHFQLRQELQDGTKNHDDALMNLMKYCPETDMPPQKPMRMAPVDDNPPNLPPRRVTQQGVNNQNRNQSDTTNAANSINNCQVDLHVQGFLLMKDVFSVHKPKRYDAMVFLFEKMIVFTSYQEGMERFTYVDHIKISDLIPLSSTPPVMLHLSDYTKFRNGQVDRDMYVLEAKSTNVKDDWTKLIEKQLWSQLEQVKRDGPKKPM